MNTVPQDVLDTLRKQLESERLGLAESLSSLKTQDPYSDPDRLNDNAASDTEANEETSHDRMEALEKQLSLSLEEIALAFGRMDAGKYGICASCGTLIDIDRLAIKPTATLCMACEKKKEH